MAGYIGTIPVPQATQNREAFTATSNQTSFATLGYTPGFIDVYLNGVKLAAADYTATNGSDVVLASGAASGDILEVVAFSAFTVADQTFTGDTSVTNLAVTGTFTSRGIDDNADAVAITIDSSENVGIGTSSPSDLLELSGDTAQPAIRLTDADVSGLYHRIFTPTNTGLAISADTGNVAADSFLRFDVDGTERMRIDSSGNVGIGNSTPSNNHANANNLVVGNGTAGGIANYVGTGLGWYAFSRANANNSDAFDGGISYDGSRNLMFHTNAGSERMRITSTGSVGIGITPKTTNATVTGSFNVNQAGLLVRNSNQAYFASNIYWDASDQLKSYAAGYGLASLFIPSDGSHRFFNTTAAATGADQNLTLNETMRIDSSGNLLVGKTAIGNDVGAEFRSIGYSSFTRDGNNVLTVRRKTSDGDIVQFEKDTTVVGSIASSGGTDLAIGSGDTGFRFIASANEIIPWNASGNTTNPDAINIGKDSQRFKDLYLSGGVFLGGTGSANKLDDYEEGTWTVTNAGDSTGTVSSNGRYVKIGRQVTCHATVSVTASFSSHNLGGLPFNPDQNSTLSSIHSAAVCVGGQVKMVSANHASGNLTTRDVNGSTVNPTSPQIIRFTIVYQTA